MSVCREADGHLLNAHARRKGASDGLIFHPLSFPGEKEVERVRMVLGVVQLAHEEGFKGLDVGQE